MSTLPISLTAAALATTYVVNTDTPQSPESTSSSSFSFTEVYSISESAPSAGTPHSQTDSATSPGPVTSKTFIRSSTSQGTKFETSSPSHESSRSTVKSSPLKVTRGEQNPPCSSSETCVKTQQLAPKHASFSPVSDLSSGHTTQPHRTDPQSQSHTKGHDRIQTLTHRTLVADSHQKTTSNICQSDSAGKTEAFPAEAISPLATTSESVKPSMMHTANSSIAAATSGKCGSTTTPENVSHQTVIPEESSSSRTSCENAVNPEVIPTPKTSTAVSSKQGSKPPSLFVLSRETPPSSFEDSSVCLDRLDMIPAATTAKPGSPLTVMGEILLGLRQDPSYKLLSVAVIHCRKMAQTVASHGNKDWYVKLYLRSVDSPSQVKKRRTGVQRASVDPAFNEIFHFHTEKEVNLLDIILCIQTGRVQKNKQMGRFRIDLGGLKRSSNPNRELFRYYAFGPIHR